MFKELPRTEPPAPLPRVGGNSRAQALHSSVFAGVPIYYFHVRGGPADAEDPEGSLQPGDEAAKACALAGARSLIAGDVLDGVLDLTARIDVEDDTGKLVFSLPFAAAVTRS